MKINKKTIIGIMMVMLSCVTTARADDDLPSVSPSATVTTNKGKTEEVTSSYNGQAPLIAYFRPNAENPKGYSVYYEWLFYKEEDTIDKPYLIRHEEETEFTFEEAGSHRVALIAYFYSGNDTIKKYDVEYWKNTTPLTFNISTSKLEFPNAFTPNGDDKNKIYKAKSDYQSIVEFKATIYNRWGQKLYEWTDIEGGWDGTYNGRDVKQGVYFVHVVAKGADGVRYNIRRDVNLLRGYDESVGDR